MNKKVLFLFLITTSFNTFSISSKEENKGTSWVYEILERQDSSFLAPSTIYLKFFIAVLVTGLIVKKIINHQEQNKKLNQKIEQNACEQK